VAWLVAVFFTIGCLALTYRRNHTDTFGNKFMSRLPNHSSPPPLYFHMPLPKIVLLLYSDFCLNTCFTDDLASHLPIFLSNHAPGGMSLLINMHSFTCIILLHLPVVFCIGILPALVK
jgi:hypothetical protein